MKLRDIPEMNYMSQDNPPKGELMMWGPGIMTGYFRNEEKTREALFNGWLASGDVAQVNPNGSIKIIDRAKNIFKLSQGEYIAPEKLENVFVQSSWIEQCWIHGTSLKDHIVAFFVLPEPKVQQWCKSKGIPYNKIDVVNNQELRELVSDDVMRLHKENKFNSLEKPKHFILLLEPFSVENDILTPTFKLKRNVAKSVFKKEID